jgi:Ca2+-binding EF-hand superfamily protein
MTARTLRIASAAFVAALVPAAGWAQDCTTNARQVVDAIYRQVLERNANGEGGTAVSQLNSGATSVRELVRNMAASNEHRQRFLSGDRNSAVNNAYKHLLGRQPDAGGLQSHLQILANEDVNAVIDNIIDSAEYQQLFSDDTVPGSKLRFCGAGSQSSSNANTVRMRFQGMDANRNGVIERGEWNGSERSFAVHDWNNDGVLSREEVRLGGRRGAVVQAEDDFDPNGPATWTARNFRLIDRNRDSRISSSEWYYAPEYFRRADRDRNRSLSLGEFTGGGNTAWDDDRDDSFTNLDINRNGWVEGREWHGSTEAFQWLDRNGDNRLSRAELVGENTAGSTFDSFASLDNNRNNSLDFSEWRWSRRSFDRYDTNGDSRVTRQEFAASGGSPAAAR